MTWLAAEDYLRKHQNVPPLRSSTTKDSGLESSTAVLLTQGPRTYITAPVYMLYHRPDGENMRAIQRLIGINPLLSICLFLFSDNISQVRIASPLHYLTPARSKHPDGLRGDPRDENFVSKATQGERMALLQKLRALAPIGLRATRQLGSAV